MRSTIRLLSHIQRIASRRDRSEINAELVDAMDDMFHPRSLAIHRCYADEHSAVVFNCAGIADQVKYCRNAYLPNPQYCVSIELDQMLSRCHREGGMVFAESGDGTQRLIFPVMHGKNLLYMIDAVLAADFPAEERVALMGLTEFFGKYISLLDYGETDTLTGLANRKTFDKHLFEVLGAAVADADYDVKNRRQAQGGEAVHCLAVCDIDHFKSVNDTYGHLMGDEVLVVLSQLMRKSFRLSDQLFRFGGEEFVVVLQPTTLADASNVFERFRRRVEDHPFSGVGHCTISIGVTTIQAGDSPTTIIDRADEALYYIKEHGRNQVAQFEELISSGKLAPKNVDHGDVELF
jgi:diguanylate cyclase (GGDEF)-like protein